MRLVSLKTNPTGDTEDATTFMQQVYNRSYKQLSNTPPHHKMQAH